MTLTPPDEIVTVVHVYQGRHFLTHATEDISKHTMCHAVGGPGPHQRQNFFIASNPALSVGDTVRVADLEILPGATQKYYLLRNTFAQSASAPAVEEAPPTTGPRGYQPDHFSPADVWDGHKAFRF